MAERRAQEVRVALLERLRTELKHTPGVAITTEQAARLFELQPEVCDRLLNELAREGFLEHREDGRFMVEWRA